MKKLTFPLVVLITLSLVLGPMGCGKRPSAVIPPSIVEAISPSSGASGVAADEAVAIQFKSPVWASQMTVPPGGEPLQLDSSELADRFRIIDASTGEIVTGTVTIEDGVKLTFELPAGESWKPDSTYWIKGTADASLEETYEEGAWQNLFLSAFTTQDLDADQFPVYHPIGGSLAQLLNDIAYDVDTSRSLSFDELKSWIETAQSKTDAANAQNQAAYGFVNKFHFWPNVINLTEVYYWEDNHALFNDILDQLLEREPDSTQLKSQLTAQVARGDRVFCARDFITSLMFGFKTYWEVHYGLVINLDNADQTGVRRPYVQEILVHQYGADGLPLLHDPHTEKLAAIFASSATIPLGKAWDLCLRGNLKKTKYNAIVVDKLAEAPDAEFYIERVELTCGCDIFSDLDTSVPVVPWKWKPPPHPEPVPVPFEPQPLPNPNPPKNPHAPPNPKPRPGGSPVYPDPFPPDLIPLPKFPEEELEEELEPKKDTSLSKGCGCPNLDCKDSPLVKSKLEEEVEPELKTAEKNWEQDKENWNKVYFESKEGREGIIFNDPCLQKLFEEYLKKAQELLDQTKAKLDAPYSPYKGIRTEKDIKDPVMRAMAERKDWWGTILHEKGPWSKLSGKAWALLVGVPSDFIVIAKERSLAFDSLFADVLLGERERNEARRILNDPQAKKEDKEKAQELLSTPPQRVAAKTWDQAVEEAVNATVAATQEELKEKLKKKGQEVTVAAMQIWTGVWQEYAKLRKEFYKNQLEILIATSFFVVDFPELKKLEAGELSPEQWEELKRDKLTVKQQDQLKRMINVIFNSEGELKQEGEKDEKAEYARIKKALEDYRKKSEEEHALKWNETNQLGQLTKKFKEDAKKCCEPKHWEEYLRTFNKKHVLEDYLEWCKNPSCWVNWTVERAPRPLQPLMLMGDVERYCLVLCQLKKDTELDTCKGFLSYVDYVICLLCDERYGYKCDKLKKPCDPECEVCPEKTQPIMTPPAVTPGITPPPTFTPPPTVTPTLPPVTPPPTEVIPPPTETLPPTKEVLRAEASANAKSLRDEKGCSSTLTISYSAQDLTGGSYPVIKVVLTVNGQVWHDSGTISTASYQNSVSKEVGCGQTFNIQVTATNKSGQMVIVPGSITTPIP